VGFLLKSFRSSFILPVHRELLVVDRALAG
jgi:hypothetical protein